MRQRILAFPGKAGIKLKLRTNKDGIHLTDDAPMLPSDLDHLTPVQRLVIEQAFVMAQELEARVDSATHGQIETIDDFAPRWGEWAVWLGIEDLSTITILGDGAEWIWNAASRQFSGCNQVLNLGQTMGTDDGSDDRAPLDALMIKG